MAGNRKGQSHTEKFSKNFEFQKKGGKVIIFLTTGKLLQIKTQEISQKL